MTATNTNQGDQVVAGDASVKEISEKLFEEIDDARRTALANLSTTKSDPSEQIIFSDVYQGTVGSGTVLGTNAADLDAPEEVLPEEPTEDPGEGPSEDPPEDPVDEERDEAQPKASEPKAAEPADLWDGKDWRESIGAEGVDQAQYGDCYFEAALASLANTDKGKQKIHDMVSVNEDGSYTVRFPGALDKPVIVSQCDLEKWNLNNSGTWATVIEAAFMEYTRSGEPWRKFPEIGGMPPLSRVSNAREAAKLLSGDDVVTDQFALTDLGSQQLTLGLTSKENVKRDLAWAMENQSIVTAGTGFDFAKFIGGHSTDELVPGHAFSVVGFDKDTETVIVRNPWSYNPGELENVGDTCHGITNIGEGKLSMSLDTFMKNFSDMTISGRSNLSSTAEHAIASRDDVINHGVSALKGIFERDGDKVKNEAKSAIKDFASIPSELLHGSTTMSFEYLKHNLGHPEYAVIPFLAPSTFITEEVMKNLPFPFKKKGD